MWNIITANRLLDIKRKQQAQKKHLKALSSIRSKIDNSTPREYTFLYSRPKANQLKHERHLDIENSNNILVNKMMKSPSYIRSKTDAFLKQSLNSAVRNKKQREIDSGNQKLVKKLQNATSIYSCAAQYNKDFQRYKSNMANSRMDPYYNFESQPQVVTRKPSRPYSAKR